MSLDIHLYRSFTWDDTGEKDYDTIFHTNITHNLGKMAEEAGIYKVMWEPEEIFGSDSEIFAWEIQSQLEEGVAKLKENPKFFKQFNPPNGWGNYYGLLRVATEYLEAVKKYPHSIISVDR